MMDLSIFKIFASDEDGPRASTLEIIGASFVGCIFVTLADLVFNPGAEAVTTRTANLVNDRLPFGIAPTTTEFIAFMVFFLLGLGLCFVFRPRTRPAAFVRGSSVIAVLFGMNVAVTSAQAQALTLGNQTNISVIMPSSYGPLGIGTILTGQTNVALKQIKSDTQAVTCNSIIKVGKFSYCQVTARELGLEAVQAAGKADAKVWIQTVR